MKKIIKVITIIQLLLSAVLLGICAYDLISGKDSLELIDFYFSLSLAILLLTSAILTFIDLLYSKKKKVEAEINNIDCE